MKIIKLWGGLGNQMFQYALGFALSKCGNKVLFDVSWLDNNREYVGENRIDEVFLVSLNYASDELIKKYVVAGNDVLSRLGRKLGMVKNKYYYEEDSIRGKYQSFILEDPDDLYLEGYWQAEKYFKDQKIELLKAFTFRKEVNVESMPYLSRVLLDKSAVSVHVRLGDYEKTQNSVSFGRICTEQYYEAAFKYIESKILEPHYYLFSDEPEKAKKIMKNRDYCVIDCNNPQTGWNDMLIMSSCRHNIIANSTFSWWAAYINKKTDKIVILPAKWTNDREFNDIYVDGWIRK